jgi:hypothetical protein
MTAAQQQTPQKPQQQSLPRPSRMTLDKVVKGRIEAPLKVLLYGQEGVGKSTFGANAPSPIFLGAEQGTEQLDVTRFPAPQSWQDVLDAVRTLQDEKHDFRTVVVDTVDWVEPILWSHMVRRDAAKFKDGLDTIEDYGYGKGYQAALDDWRVFLAALERLRQAKGMHVVLLAHAWIKPFKNPEGPDYDRYELKINQKAAGLLKEWVDDVLFARHEELAHKESGTKRVRGVSTGARVIRSERTAAYDAKNRHSLPDPLPLSWAEYEAAVKAGRVADPAAMRAEIQRKAGELGGDIEKATADLLTKAGDDTQKLAVLNNRLNARIAQKEQA